LQLVPCQQQEGSSDCGLFALAFLERLLQSDNPSQLRFAQNRMRLHLWACLQRKFISRFPLQSEEAPSMSSEQDDRHAVPHVVPTISVPASSDTPTLSRKCTASDQPLSVQAMIQTLLAFHRLNDVPISENGSYVLEAIDGQSSDDDSVFESECECVPSSAAAKHVFGTIPPRRKTDRPYTSQRRPLHTGHAGVTLLLRSLLGAVF
jgi:hypothetical protein